MKKLQPRMRRASILSASVSAVALTACIVATPALAQSAGGGAAAGETSAAADPAPLEEIVITGFRRSLEAAIDVKRESVTSVDAIVAEDIAKFPDLNLAESLQRIPGISIARDGGEGRAITVRGLGPQFTRVRVNGLETIATSSDGASVNRDRAFDFNVFASELFSSLVVHKTAEASLDEGSLGAVVDLNTGNPLRAPAGWTAVASAQAAYNTLSEEAGPRLAGLVSWKNDDSNLGVSASVAYQDSKTLELGNNTVRWARARFDSVNGTPCYTQPNTGGSVVSSPACDAVAGAFHPRIPRYGEVAHDKERLGATASIQWAPTDTTTLSIDGLYSRFAHERAEKWGEVLFRGNERAIDVIDYTIDPNTNNLVSGTFNDAWVRTENYFRESETQFYQIGAKLEQDITDTLRVELLGGMSQSDADIPVETTIVFDDRDAQGYRYDYSDSRQPLLAFGTSVTDPASFQLSEIRDRPSNVTNEFETLSLKTEWDATEEITMEAGAVYRKFDFESVAYRRDTVVCPNRTTAGPDVVLGTITCTPRNVFGPNAVYGFQVTPQLAEMFNLGDAGQPDGTTTSWLVPNLDTAADFTKLYERTAEIDTGNNRSVTEKVTGGYIEANIRSALFGLEYAANLGVRYVKTDQSSTGISNGQVVTVERDYDDWLPSFNLALFPTDDIIVRAAVAQVMTRPTLGDLTPGGSVDGFNYRISFGNPFLDPFRATAYDAAVEWYFLDEAVASAAVFAKEVESFPIAATRTGTYASTGLPLSLIPPGSPASANPEGQAWEIRTRANGEGATLKGIEISIQTPFTFLPDFWSNFGIIANATFVDSSADYEISGEVRTSTLFGLSKQAYNGTLYYEDDVFSARVSASYRSGFVDGTSATGNFFEGYNSSFNLDASASYQLTEELEVSVEGVNLTDDYRDRWVDEDADRNYEYNHFGRTILFGVRYKL